MAEIHSNLLKLCYFEELSYGDTGSIHDFVGVLKPSLADKASAYLANGKVLAIAPGLTHDVFTGEPIGTLMMLSDDHWSWGSDLAYYVKKYRLGLPSDFLSSLSVCDSGKNGFTQERC